MQQLADVTRSSFSIGVFACALLLAFCWSSPLRAEPVRILVAASHRQGASGERELKYPKNDARAFAQLMTSLGGVPGSNAIVLADPTPHGLEQGLKQAEEIAKRHAADEVTLFFYFSGHGDRQALHLGPAAVSQTELGKRLARIPSALRIVIIDACRSTQRLRGKGVSVAPGFAINVAAPTQATGTVWIYASSDGEIAQESEEIGGGVFTHYWLSALRGAADVNGDRRVTLHEAYDFAYNYTLVRTARAVVQRPTTSLELKQTAPIVLTQLFRAGTADTAWLELPAGSDLQYLVFAKGSHAVVAELWSSPSRRLEIALPPGSYLVQQRRPDGTGGASNVKLGRNERRALSQADFRAFSRELLAMKGGQLELFPHELELLGGLTLNQGLFGAFAGGRYAYRLGGYALSFGVELGRATETNSANWVREQWLAIDLLAEKRFNLEPFELRFGLGPTFQMLNQEIERRDAVRLRLAGYDPTREYDALLFGGRALFGIRYEFAPEFWVGAFASGSGLVANSSKGGLAFRYRAGLGLNLGVGF